MATTSSAVTPVPVPTLPSGISSSNERKGITKPDTHADAHTPKSKLNTPASLAPPHQQTAEEKEIQNSFIQGSMTSEVQNKLKSSPELRRSILGTPVSLKAQEAVVKGQMSPDLRSLMINEINTIRQPRSTEATGRSVVQGNLLNLLRSTSVISAPSVASAITPMGNLNSAELRAVETVKTHDESKPNGTNSASASELENEKKSDIPPPKRTLKATRSNRPERPVPSKSTVTGIYNKYRLSVDTKHSLRQSRTLDPGNVISPEPARVISDVSALPSDQDITRMKPINDNMVMQKPAKVYDRSPNDPKRKSSGLESSLERRESKRKRDSSHGTTRDLIFHPRTSHSEHSNSPSDPSQGQRALTSIFGTSSKTSPAGLSQMSDTRNSKRRSDNSRLIKTASSAVPDKPTHRKGDVSPVDADDYFMNDAAAMDDDNEWAQQDLPMGSNSSDEDYSAEDDDDPEDEKDRASIVLGNESGLEEGSMPTRKSRTKAVDVKSHDYTSWKRETLLSYHYTVSWLLTQ